jgi:hypothetical protein
MGSGDVQALCGDEGTAGDPRTGACHELTARILAYLDDINAEPVVHTWTYKIGEAA